MLQCWQQNPNDRPTFSMLKDKITKLVENNNVCCTFFNAGGGGGQVYRASFVPFEMHTHKLDS